nr:MFS transporter [Bacilli bacterium]
MQPTSRKTAWLGALYVIIMAANLRAAISGVGPLTNTIIQQTGLSVTVAGLMTSLPLVAFAIFSPLAPMIARRYGLERVLIGALFLLMIAILVRSSGSATLLLLGMFLAGVAIAIGNVLLPSLIKRDFPQQVGLLTGMYSVAMGIFASIAAGITIPMANIPWLGWRGSLGSWALLAGIGFLFWLPLYKEHHRPDNVARYSVWRSSLAWQITFFMGLQSFLFYATSAWLPTLLQDRGMNATTAGWMLAIMQFISLPASFFTPILAAALPRQRSIVAGVVIGYLMGYGGLLAFPVTSLVWLWVTLIGIAGGASISLALTWFGLRTKTKEEAAKLSGMAQSIGYLIASIGPVLIGYVHTITGNWSTPLLILLLVIVGLGLSGIRPGSGGFIRDPSSLPRRS